MLDLQEDARSFQELLRKFQACPEAIEWVGTKRSLDDLWLGCPNPEWLLISIRAMEHSDLAGLRLFAVACARRHAELFPDERCSRILATAEHAASGRVGDRELLEAADSCDTLRRETNRRMEWRDDQAAAISCVRDTVHLKPLEAARRASRNGVRASANSSAEAEWQISELRRILQPELPTLKARVHMLLTEVSARKRGSRSAGPRVARGQGIDEVIQQHFEIASQCAEDLHRAPFRQTSSLEVTRLWDRLAANLDGLRIAGPDALRVGRVMMNDDPWIAGVVAIVTPNEELQVGGPDSPVALLGSGSSEVRAAARWGLRLADQSKLEAPLRQVLGRAKWDLASAGALDVLAFRRLPVACEHIELAADQDHDSVILVVEAMGRVPELGPDLT